ncbi:galactosyltransferase-related protein [Microbacterium sp. ARD31]|uniref:glycosyltransferase family 2 protein n=1 Tax=Microbacterium sp. ARD31 TaxID=2962576 RepID=UPI0028816B90|nr:galactosyltransferase-related protein [Microbacterium sp. ARD31]MDT0185425.1 galactosyltransferase-related protein [Microbacterium sp. ARD31]
MSGARTAVVTVVHGRREHLARQRASLARSTTSYEHVVVAVDDPEVADSSVTVPPHPLGLPVATARNRGAAHALDRGATTLVFLDVDCLAAPDLVEAYADVVAEEPRTVWSGPVTYLDPRPPGGYDLAALGALDAPHPARPAPAPGERLADADPDLFWSLSFACSAEAWRATGGFCEDYVGYGGEDTDFARVVLAAGLDLGWVGAARAYHQWHPVSRPPVEHVADIVRNAEVYRRRWGVVPMRGWLEAFEERGLVRCDDDGRWLLSA